MQNFVNEKRKALPKNTLHKIVKDRIKVAVLRCLHERLMP